MSWSHYRTLLSLTNENEIEYYIMICKEQNLSVRKLQDKIKNKDYERLPEKAKNKLIINKKSNIVDFVKSPIVIRNKHNYEIISEQILQKMILEDLNLL